MHCVLRSTIEQRSRSSMRFLFVHGANSHCSLRYQTGRRDHKGSIKAIVARPLSSGTYSRAQARTLLTSNLSQLNGLQLNGIIRNCLVGVRPVAQFLSFQGTAA
jgi:hypothetical protein